MGAVWCPPLGSVQGSVLRAGVSGAEEEQSWHGVGVLGGGKSGTRCMSQMRKTRCVGRADHIPGRVVHKLDAGCVWLWGSLGTVTVIPLWGQHQARISGSSWVSFTNLCFFHKRFLLWCALVILASMTGTVVWLPHTVFS